MSIEGEGGAESPRWRLRFSILALLIFVTLVSLVLTWFVQPRKVVATALFQVDSAAPHGSFKTDERAESGRDFAVLKQTQLALLKCNYLLTAAIRNPGVGSLPILATAKDPVGSLQSHLDVSFPENAEIISIQLRGTEAQSQDLVLIVDSIAKAYKDEVIESAASATAC